MPQWLENGKSHCLCRLLLIFPLCPRSDKKKAHRRIYNAIVSYVPQLSQLAKQPGRGDLANKALEMASRYMRSIHLESLYMRAYIDQSLTDEQRWLTGLQ